MANVSFSKDWSMAKKSTKQPLSITSDNSRLDKLYVKISNHIETARKAFQRTVSADASSLISP